MSNKRRTAIEVATLILLVGALAGIWLWAAHERREALVAQAARCNDTLEGIRAETDGWTEALAQGQAEASFRAAAAGIHADVLSGRTEALQVAVAELLRLPGVVFVHLLKPDGSTLVSSNQKYTETGRAGERAAWALGVQDFSIRMGDLPGTTELASPIKDAAGVKAVLWMAYDTSRAKERAHPQTGARH